MANAILNFHFDFLTTSLTRFLGGPNSISRTGPFGPSSKILGSPSQLDKAKLLLPVVYNYTTFRAMMSKDYPEIQHQFDPWHWIKVIWNSLLSFLLRFE